MVFPSHQPKLFVPFAAISPWYADPLSRQTFPRQMQAIGNTPCLTSQRAIRLCVCTQASYFPWQLLPIHTETTTPRNMNAFRLHLVGIIFDESIY